jgi:hypothetical protein
MPEDHRSELNPNGTVELCELRTVHPPHEWQVNFGDYYNAYCPGVTLDHNVIRDPVERAKEECRKELAKAMGAPDNKSWTALLGYVTYAAKTSHLRFVHPKSTYLQG